MRLLVTAGRTGVERGACEGAVAAGIEVTGFMRSTARDEIAALPDHLAARLTPCPGRAIRLPALRSLELAEAVLVIVPDAGADFPVVAYILKHARRLGRELRIHTSDQRPDAALDWLAGRDRVYVTGPRGTRWRDGQSVARRLVRLLGPAEAIA